MAQRPTLTVSAAVEAFDIERRTLQRLLATSQMHGASKDNRGRWIIPVETLHAAGFRARKTWQSVATNDATGRDTDATNNATQTQKTPLNQRKTSATDDATDLRLYIAQLEAEIRAERQLREATERNLEDLRTSLRMLDAGHVQPTTVEQPARKWWRRS